MNYTERKCDVTKIVSKYIIAHCISCDCAMGAGVVIPIMKKHHKLKTNCIEYTKNKGLDNSLGTTFRYKDDMGICYNMFSKRNVKDNAENLGPNIYMHNLKSCLIDLRNQMILNDEKYLAMPKIGSGLDRGDWSKIRSIILDVFEKTDVTIFICLWE